MKDWQGSAAALAALGAGGGLDCSPAALAALGAGGAAGLLPEGSHL